MRRALWALAVLAMLGSGCTSQTEPAGAPPAEPVARNATETKPSPPPVQPLTGRQGDTSSRAVLAIKIDNAPAAVPQKGLDRADVVVEEEVEGGLTRFVALFQSDASREVGPVRSGREVDALLLPPFNPVLVTSGQAGAVKRDFDKRDLLLVEEGKAKKVFRRDESRAAPNNLYAATRPLFEKGNDQPPPAEPVWDFAEEAPAAGKKAKTAALDFSVFADVGWTWTGTGYARSQNGSPHDTAAGRQLTADNVVVMRVASRQGDRRDSAGNPTLTLDVVGKGKATVLRDGQAYQARWRKPSADDQIEWLTPDGDPLPLKPGQTWVELLKKGSDLTLR